jgi:hypothetical protein
MRSPKTAALILAPFALTLMGGGAARPQDAASTPGVFREADAGMTCAQIGDEAATLSEAMGEETPSGGWLSALGGLAKSGAALLVPGGGLAVAGVDAATRPGRERDEAERMQTLNRWYYLNGLHAGRGCREQTAALNIQPATLTTPATSR